MIVVVVPVVVVVVLIVVPLLVQSGFSLKKKLIVNTSKYKILKLALVFFWTGSVFAGPVLRTLTTPYNYYNYLAAQLILPSLLLREVCTVSVSSGPCSSPA